jgi:hypothetical protein
MFHSLREFSISDLSWGCGFQTQAPSGGLEFVGRDCTFSFQLEAFDFFSQFFAFSAQVFALVTDLDGGEVLLGSEDEAACEDQSTEQQQRES